MEKVDSFELAVEYLKEHAILTTTGKNRFVMKTNGIVLCSQEGSSFKLNLKDFASLYGKDEFYVFEDNSVFIDNDKDEAYYRYYKK